MSEETDNVQVIYRHRFHDREAAARTALWRVLCDEVFARYVDGDDTVLDLGAGHCEFINQIRGGRKIAVDLNPDVERYALPEVQVIRALSTDMRAVGTGTVDVVFISNFLEHLPNTAALMATLEEVHRVLAARGRVVILQPNIRLVGGAYWDFVDHHLPLTEKSLSEALRACNFRIHEVRARFLPYTTKGKLPTSPWLARVYLRIPIAQWLMGKQSLLVAGRS